MELKVPYPVQVLVPGIRQHAERFGVYVSDTSCIEIAEAVQNIEPFDNAIIQIDRLLLNCPKFEDVA